MSMETKQAAQSPETRAALHEVLAAFEAFKSANDQRLEAMEAKRADVLLEEKVARIDAGLNSAQSRLDRALADLRRPAKGDGEIQWDPAKGELSAEALAGADAVVNLAGAGIGDRRWTAEYKRELVDSRVKGTTLLAERIAECSQRPGVLLNGSAIGIYGHSTTAEFTESSDPGTGFLADLCV